MSPNKNPYFRFLAPYYIFNYIAVLSYLVIRRYLDPTLIYHVDVFGFERENQALFSLGLFLFIRFLNCISMDEFLSTFFTFFKAFVIIFSLLGNWKLAIYYIIYCAIIFITCEQPVFEGKTNVVIYNSTLFNQKILMNKTKSKKVKENTFVTYIVFFYCHWHPHCNHISPIFSKLSNKYSCERLQFVKINVAKYYDIASKCNIDTSGSSKQLPTIILYEHGEEVGRVPKLNSSSFKKLKFNEANIDAWFELKKRHEIATFEINKFNNKMYKKKQK
eukprot:TRINITY_DN5977_c0_g1_i1.p1 TRINITY_DN5977_c0_g1~~TRINITY_DN5977_c0_g1_i1.p1  ORF type:complete len:275 (+),score=30.21 TRINITY_DN5977_c0_g1_i1:105-929(+)